ncbi:hypothetical protein Pmani_015236 [Petrolisthes manimaculis]|uniref:Uncharacterized protein n=1 Tax=Petrolisthes manimaculis TaxID=1843537 RepID=A0AAE1U7U8_9EUCA|nr:hypothetical protein Pmani_015236 [Petrolisthes manimaculis]
MGLGGRRQEVYRDKMEGSTGLQEFPPSQSPASPSLITAVLDNHIRPPPNLNPGRVIEFAGIAFAEEPRGNMGVTVAGLGLNKNGCYTTVALSIIHTAVSKLYSYLTKLKKSNFWAD